MNTSFFSNALCPSPSPLRYLLACFALILATVPARATSVVPPEFDQLVNESDCVVRAVVKSVTSEWRGEPGSGGIFTRVELEVREVIAGVPAQPLVLEMLGGKVGEQEMTLAGAPKFTVGQEDVLFIQGNGQNVYPLVAIMHGRYPILKEAGTGREYMARSNLVPLTDTAEVALPMTEGAAATMQMKLKTPAQALTPVAFAQRIKAAVVPNYRRPVLQK